MVTKNKIEDALFEMGLPATMEGFGFIVDVMLLMHDGSNDWNKLYEAVAVKYGTAMHIVPRRIKTAITWLRDNPCENYDAIDRYIGFADNSVSVSISRMYRILNRDNNISDLCDEDHIKILIKNVLKEILITV